MKKEKEAEVTHLITRLTQSSLKPSYSMTRDKKVHSTVKSFRHVKLNSHRTIQVCVTAHGMEHLIGHENVVGNEPPLSEGSLGVKYDRW